MVLDILLKHLMLLVLLLAGLAGVEAATTQSAVNPHCYGDPGYTGHVCDDLTNNFEICTANGQSSQQARVCVCRQVIFSGLVL